MTEYEGVEEKLSHSPTEYEKRLLGAVGLYSAQDSTPDSLKHEDERWIVRGEN